MADSVLEAVLTTIVFAIATSLVISSEGLTPTVMGSHFLGGLTLLVAGVSLSIAFYEWDSYLHIFHAEEHELSPEGLSSKISSLVVSMAGFMAFAGILSMAYGLLGPGI